jgi:uncharacterized protein (TIGR02646 family)
VYYITRPAEPAYFRSPTLAAERRRAEKYFKKNFATRAQERYTFQWRDIPEWMPDLEKAFHNKCAYCERIVGHDVPGTFNRFRPNRDALNLKGSASPDHYWWLAYRWENLYLSCVGCDLQKGKRFPVDGTRATRRGGKKAIAQEKRLLIDPCDENPIAHLVFFEDGLVAAREGSRKGESTIDILGLNRAELVDARSAHALRLRDLLEEGRRLAPRAAAGNVRMKAIVGALAWSDMRPFALLHLQLLQTWLAYGDEPWLKKRLEDADDLIVRTLTLTPQQRRQARAHHELRVLERELEKAASEYAPSVEAAQALIARSMLSPTERRGLHQVHARRLSKRDKYSLGDNHPDAGYRSTTRLVEKIRIKNFRGIDELEIDVAKPQGARAPWLMLLGENATGKSSILQAIALALISDKDRKYLKVNASRYLKDKKSSGFVEVQLSDTPPQKIELTRKRSTFTGSKEAMVLVLGYGSTRLLPRTDTKERRGRASIPARIYNLFDPTYPLVDADRSLTQLKGKNFDEVALALKRLLDLPEKGVIRRKGRQIFVTVHGRRCTLDELSDGYQTLIALATEIITVLRSQWTGALEQGEGILLVDELDTHLHPRWKMRIVEAIRRAFPRLQVIATTHDPLCLRGLNDGEVAVLERTHGHRIKLAQDLPPIGGLRVDQILQSEHFGLSTTLDPAVEGEFHEYYELLLRPRLTRAEEKRRDELRNKLSPLEVLGAGRRERLLLTEVDKKIARMRAASSEEERETARVATRGLAAKLLRKKKRKT